jgi:hypothetical protein
MQSGKVWLKVKSVRRLSFIRGSKVISLIILACCKKPSTKHRSLPAQLAPNRHARYVFSILLHPYLTVDFINSQTHLRLHTPIVHHRFQDPKQRRYLQQAPMDLMTT